MNRYNYEKLGIVKQPKQKKPFTINRLIWELIIIRIDMFFDHIRVKDAKIYYDDGDDGIEIKSVDLAYCLDEKRIIVCKEKNE